MKSTLMKDAGASVERRGFLDGNQAEPFANVLLAAQMGKLNEEVGEFARSLRSEDGPDIKELADIGVVLAAIAYVMDWDLDAAIAAKCEADEARGYKHNGTGGGAMVDTPSSEGHVYRDFG